MKLDPTQIITGWTALIAVVSIVNKFLLGPFAPNVARFISAIISIPSGHIANAIEDLVQLWGDITNPPPPPPVGPNASGGTSTPKPPPPAAMRGKVGLALWASAPLVALGIGMAVVACTPAQGAMFSKIEQVVLDDLAAGKTRVQIEVDVGNALAGQPGADVAIVLEDVLTFLIDAGYIPPNLIPQARMMLAEERPIAEAHRK
jgi:hypothetical protein